MSKFKILFSSHITPIVSSEKDKYLSLASLDTLRNYLPKIDTEKNIDLLPVVFNAFVANKFNKNGDGVDTETAINMANLFINKPINIEHNRQSIIGVVLTANFSEYGTDKSLNIEDLKDIKKPFNVTLGGILWRTINEKITDIIEETNDETSDFYQKVSASWEVGFSDYSLVLIEGDSRNLEDAKTIIEDPKEMLAIEMNLKGLGGSGKIDEKTRIYRLAKGEVLPLGIGLTEKPAADVKGIAVNKIEKEEELVDNEVNSSHLTKTDVNLNESNNIMKVNLKKLSDINDEVLKQVTANEMTDFIKNQIDENLSSLEEKTKSESKVKEEALAAEKEKAEKLSKDYETLKAEHETLKKTNSEISEKLTILTTKLAEIDQKQKDQEKLEVFSSRMSKLDSSFKFEKEEREVIAKDIKELDEEGFKNYENKLTILLKNKVKASETISQETVGNVIDNGNKEKSSIPNTQSVEQTIAEKMKKAFSLEDGIILEFGDNK